MGVLKLETKTRDKLEDDQFANLRRQEIIKQLEGILYEEDGDVPHTDPQPGEGECHKNCDDHDELALIEEEIKNGEVEEDVRSDDSPHTIDTEECEEIVINEDDDDDNEHDVDKDAEIEYENHSNYSDIMRESETLDEMDCSIISESNLSDAVNLTMDSVTATERRLEKQVFPEADSVMQEIEQFIQASPVVKPPVPGLVDQDNYDNHDTPKSLPSPIPTISKSSIPTNVITPTRMVSREKICERAELDSPSSILS